MNHGHVWQINTSSKTSDVYIENSSREGSVHVSHHESGQWHVAYKTEDGRKKKKYLAVTRDRGQVAPGWFHASRLVILKQDAILAFEEAAAIQVPFDEDFDGICIDVFISDVTPYPIVIPRAFPVASLRLEDGREVQVFARPYNAIDLPQDAFSNVVQEALESLGGTSWDGSPRSIVVICDSEEEYGYIQQVELRIA